MQMALKKRRVRRPSTMPTGSPETSATESASETEHEEISFDPVDIHDLNIDRYNTIAFCNSIKN